MIEIPSLGGHEQKGRRPAIILADTGTPVAIIIPCTSNLQTLRFPHSIKILPSLKNGLDAMSIALVFQIRAIDKQKLVKKIGALDNVVLKEMNAMIKRLLSI